MAAVTALRERARAAVFAAGGRGFVRFLPAGETALLVSDAPRRCGDVPALLDGCRAAGFDARERDGLLLLTPTEAALRALDVPARIDVDWDAPDAPTAAFAAYLMRRADRPLTEDGLRLVVETLRLLWQDEAHVRAGLPALDVPARIDVDWDAPDAPTAAFAAYLMRRADRPLTEDGLRLVVETLRLLWQDEAHVRAGLPALRARAAACLRVGEDSGFFLSGALLAGWMDGLCAKKTD